MHQSFQPNLIHFFPNVIYNSFPSTLNSTTQFFQIWDESNLEFVSSWKLSNLYQYNVQDRVVNCGKHWHWWGCPELGTGITTEMRVMVEENKNCQTPVSQSIQTSLILMTVKCSLVQTIQFVSNTNYHLLCLSLSCLMALCCLSRNWKETIYFYDLICISWVLCLQSLEHVNWFLWKCSGFIPRGLSNL